MTDVVVHQPQSKSIWRRIGEVLAGAALGFIVWSLIGPGMISWWYEPPSKDAFSCAGSVKSALGQFVVMQLVSALVGAVLIAVVLFFVRRWWAKRHAAATPPTPPTAPPPTTPAV